MTNANTPSKAIPLDRHVAVRLWLLTLSGRVSKRHIREGEIWDAG